MIRTANLKESEIFEGQKCSVKLQFDNPESSKILYEGESPKKPFTYTYSEHGVVLAIKDDPKAPDMLKSESYANSKEAWTSLKRVEAEHSKRDFIPLEPELRTMRYNTYRNGYVRFEYGYALLYAIGEDIGIMEKITVGDVFKTNLGIAFEVLNRVSIDKCEEIKPEPYVPEGIMFELKVLKEDK